MKLTDIKNIIVIGCGGTGSQLIVPLCRYLFSKRDEFIGNIIFVDGDSYSESNRDRQNFNPEFINKNKAEYQALVISKILPEIANRISFIPEYLSKNAVEEIIEENTVVFNCTDNLAIRKYVEDAISELSTGCHICCGNENHSGQVQIHYRDNGESITPSIYDRFPEFNSDNGDRSSMNCQQLSELPSGGQTIISNMMAATIAIALFYKLTTYNIILCSKSAIHYDNLHMIDYNLLFGNFNSIMSTTNV